MTTCLGKSCLFGLLCMSFVNVYDFVCMFLSLLILGSKLGFDCTNSCKSNWPDTNKFY